MKYLLTFFASLFLFVLYSFGQQDTLKQYTGKYTFGEDSPVSEVTVIFKDGMLMMQSAAGSSELRLDKEDNFVIVDYNGSASFRRDKNKAIVGVYIEAMGYTMNGTKEVSNTPNQYPLLPVPLPPDGGIPVF